MQKGLTALEFLVVLAVLGLVVMVATPEVADYVSNARLRSAAEQVSDGLQLARMEAIRRNTTVDFVPAGTGWSVVLPASGQIPAQTLVSRAPFSFERAVSTTASDTRASYNGAGRLVTAGTFSIQLGLVGRTCVAGGGLARCLNVEAERGGSVRTCDPALAASHPEACSS